jgi:general secretion pathway protein F
MARFDYIAVDSGGRTRSGQIVATDEQSAQRDLQRRRLAPVKLTLSAAAAQAGVASRRGDRLSPAQLTMVTRQLATLITVAPLEEALRTLALQADRPAARRILSGTHEALLEGWRLSEAMARQGRAFPPLYRAMVAAGESSGSLPEILDRLADLLEREQHMRGKVTTALVYPAALAFTAIAVVIGLMTFVVPKVVDQFESMGQVLPLLTRAVILVSDGLRNWGWLAALLTVIGGFAFARALGNTRFRLGFDGKILALPLVGRVIRDVHAARLARTLSTMIASGLPVMEGLQLTARTVNNRVLRAATQDMATSIREGGGLSNAMKRAGVFPAILIHMTASGENAGRLDTMLGRAADYLEREFNAVTSVALSLLEPIIIIVMGAVVATIVLSILLPILQINSMVGR